MNAADFGNYYGKHIFNAQVDPGWRTRSAWPYVDPNLPNTSIAIKDPDVKRYFIPYGINYKWYMAGVVYYPGRISYAPLPYGPYSAISFQFSGCYMAKLCFRGDWYAFHISTDNSPSRDCKEVWKKFLSQHKHDITTFVMFRPTDDRVLFNKWCDLHYNRKCHSPITLSGLIAEDNRCYTLIYDCDAVFVEKGYVGASAVDYIRECSPSLLCYDGDYEYFRQLMDKSR